VSTVERSFSRSVPHIANVMPVMQRFVTVIGVVVDVTCTPIMSMFGTSSFVRATGVKSVRLMAVPEVRAA